jgi:hypothetical protein
LDTQNYERQRETAGQGTTDLAWHGNHEIFLYKISSQQEYHSTKHSASRDIPVQNIQYHSFFKTPAPVSVIWRFFFFELELGPFAGAAFRFLL